MRQAAVFITSLMALVLVVAPLGAQQQQGTQGVETPKCMVEGQVVKLGTAEPLRKAWVVLRKAQGRSEPYTTTTDDSGRFRLEEVEPGRYRLFAVRNGYVRQEWGQRGSSSAGTPLTLRPGQRVRDLVFKLERAAVIAGRVYDEDGEALLNVRVQALRYRYLRGQRQLRPVSSDQSNDLGEYRLYGLAPGEYFISATYTSPLVSVLRFFGGFGAAAFERRGRGGRRGGGDEGYAPTYYPGTNDAGQASPIEISAGGEIRGIDFMLLPTGTRRIRGTVYNNLSGQLGRNIAVWLLVRNSTVFSFSNRNRAQVQDDGSFELRGVTPGSYTLLANYSDGRKRYTARQAVEVGGSDVEGVQLVIGPGVTVAGTHGLRARCRARQGGPVPAPPPAAAAKTHR